MALLLILSVTKFLPNSLYLTKLCVTYSNVIAHCNLFIKYLYHFYYLSIQFIVTWMKATFPPWSEGNYLIYTLASSPPWGIVEEQRGGYDKTKLYRMYLQLIFQDSIIGTRYFQQAKTQAVDSKPIFSMYLTIYV